MSFADTRRVAGNDRGTGPHLSPGAGLALLKARIAVKKSLKRLPIFQVILDERIGVSGGLAGGGSGVSLTG